MLYSSWLLVIYFLELYISVLTTIIEISTCDFFFNNNILTQSITFLPVFSSKYVLSRIKNIFPIQENASNHSNICISNMVTYFWIAKQTWSRIRKKSLEWKSLKKDWFSQQFNMPCWNLPNIDVSHMRTWKCQIAHQPFFPSSKSVFLGGQCFGKTSSPT